MVFHPDPTTVPPLGMPKSNTFIKYTYTTKYILKLRNIYLNYENNHFTINTLDFSPRTLLVLSNYPNLNILYLHLQITPQLPTYPKLPCTTQLPSRK